MADALCHMHKNALIHCDLKPENVLCTSNPASGKDDWDIKITDFGLSKPIIEDDDHSDLTFCGSPLYMAPEMLFKQVDTVHRPYVIRNFTDKWFIPLGRSTQIRLICGVLAA